MYSLSISLVIPALNEAKSIRQIIREAKPYVDEVWVIDGQSSDATGEVAQQEGAKVLVYPQRGKGRALRRSLDCVRGEIVVFMDADGSHRAQDIPSLVQPILEQRADHVSGSRYLAGSMEATSTPSQWFRWIVGGVIICWINWRFKTHLTESQNGFRAIKTKVLKKLYLEENLTTIEQEMIIKTLKKGYRLVEVPTVEEKRLFGRSRIKLYAYLLSASNPFRFRYFIHLP